MYHLTSAIAKPIDSRGRWQSISLGDMLLPDVFANYARVYATLTNPFLTGPVSLDLAIIRQAYGSEKITFNQFLASISNLALQTSATIPIINTRYAKYADAYYAGYKINTVNSSLPLDADIPESDRTWLLLTKPDLDYSVFYKSCLVSVNGLIHATDFSTAGAYVVDGAKSARFCNRNEIGIVSFKDIGTLSFIPIKPEMIYKTNPAELYKDRVHINLGTDVAGKTVMLVLGGYLHVLDPKTFYRRSNSLFTIEIANLPLIDRYYDSKDIIDLSSLNLDKSTVNPNQISVQQLYSDAALMAYLTMTQSFFVVLDSSDIFVETIPIPANGIPGTYLTDVVPVYPVISELGKIVNFWYSYDSGIYALNASDTPRNNYTYRTVDVNSVSNVGTNRDNQRPFFNGDLRHLQIGADI